MGILSVISIIRFLTIPEVVLRSKICSSDITVCFVELIVNYICNNLLISVPDMIYCLTVNSLFIPETACVVLIACCSFTVSESDKLIKTVISISFSLAVGCLLHNLIFIIIKLSYRLYLLGLLHHRGHSGYSMYHVLYYIIILTFCKEKKEQNSLNKSLFCSKIII